MKILLFIFTYLVVPPLALLAGEADVHDVKIEITGDGYLNVYATVQHDDEGWDHYADRWEILDMEGNVLDTRILRHPHSATPFTRSILRARIQKDIKIIRVRAHDSVHEFGGKELEATISGH